MVAAEPANPTPVEEVDEEVEDVDDEETIPFEHSISWYGADFTVDAVVSRLNRDDIRIPDFQRGFVWNRQKASRFIESLLLGLPVPGIFLATDEDQRFIVVDGQQRLKSLKFFCNGYFNENKHRKFSLTGIESEFAGKTYDSLNPNEQRKLNDSLLHAIIVRQDRPSDDKSSIYLIFERLNTGGMLLQPQEIRAAIYTGEFNDLLRSLNNNPRWRDMFGKVHNRLKDQELILRFLAMYFNGDEYQSPLTKFLNAYMGSNRKLETQSERELRQVFETTMEAIHKHLGANAFKPPWSRGRFTAAIFDSVAVGIAKRLERGDIQNAKALKSRYASLFENESYREATFAGTARATAAKQRLTIAIEAFADVP